MSSRKRKFHDQDGSKDVSTPRLRFVTAGNPVLQPSGIGCLLLTGTDKGREEFAFSVNITKKGNRG